MEKSAKIKTLNCQYQTLICDKGELSNGSTIKQMQDDGWKISTITSPSLFYWKTTFKIQFIKERCNSNMKDYAQSKYDQK